MLRFVQQGNSLPVDWPVDPSAEFQPGMVGQLGVIGNNIVCGVSDGTAPIGIIDDIRTRAFTTPSVDEVKVVNVPAAAREAVGGNIVSTVDFQVNLDNPNIIPSSFITDSVDVELIPRNGVVVFPAGTILNFDNDSDGMFDSIRTVVSYTYQIPGIPGDDSTAASGKVTIWFQRMIFQTDQYETNRRYPVGQNLFVSERGLLTTQQPTPEHPGIAVVTGPPTQTLSTLEALLL